MSSRLERPSAAATGQGRILGYDVARSLALLGMFVVHFALVLGADQEHPPWLALVLEHLDGRAAATFVVLAGVGLTLRSRRAVAAADPPAIAAARRTMFRRGLFLLALGFVNLVIWPGDILRVYGVALLLAAWLLTATDRRLLVVACGFVLGFVVLLLLFDYGENWTWSTLTYHGLWTPHGLFRNLFYDGFRSVFPWAGFLFFGMWLGRRDLRDRAMNTQVLLAAVAAVAVAEVASALCLDYFRTAPHGLDTEEIEALFGTKSMPALPLFLLSAGGTAVLVIALSVRLTETLPDVCVLPLVATGQLALTWYFGHIVVGLGTVVALGLENTTTLPVAAGCGLVFFVVAVLCSWGWRHWFRHGPLEWVMRRVAG
jgi:uncharacterized membrane protein YeiB